MKTKEILALEQEIFEIEFDSLSEEDQEKIRTDLNYLITRYPLLKKRALVWTIIIAILTVCLIIYTVLLGGMILFSIGIYFFVWWIRLEITYWHLSEKKKYSML